ncbi:MAG: hypothetical protein ABSE73_14690, partial [Planctomycetota bacterium]
MILVVILCGLGWLATRPFSPAAGKAELLEPLQVAAGGGSEMRALPADALVLTIAAGVEVVAPFALHEDPAAVGGVALVLPKGAGSREHRGKAKLALEVPAQSGTTSFDVKKYGPDARIATKYYAWVRAYWRDSC